MAGLGPPTKINAVKHAEEGVNKSDTKKKPTEETLGTVTELGFLGKVP